MAFNKGTLEKFPVTRMKLLHRNLISVSKELYELSEALDSENTYTNDFVRRRRWVVPDVMGSDHDAQHLVSPASLEEGDSGEEMQVIWELEPGAKVMARSGLPARQNRAHRCTCQPANQMEDSLTEIAAEFFRFIEQTSCEKYARLYVWDNNANGVCEPFYVDLRPGCNELAELPQKLLAAGKSLSAISEH